MSERREIHSSKAGAVWLLFVRCHSFAAVWPRCSVWALRRGNPKAANRHGKPRYAFSAPALIAAKPAKPCGGGIFSSWASLPCVLFFAAVFLQKRRLGGPLSEYDDAFFARFAGCAGVACGADRCARFWAGLQMPGAGWRAGVCRPALRGLARRRPG